MKIHKAAVWNQLPPQSALILTLLSLQLSVRILTVSLILWNNAHCSFFYICMSFTVKTVGHSFPRYRVCQSSWILYICVPVNASMLLSSCVTPKRLQKMAIINIYVCIMWTKVNKHILINIFFYNKLMWRVRKTAFYIRVIIRLHLEDARKYRFHRKMHLIIKRL